MRNENGFGSIICLDKTGKKRRKPWAVRITTGWVDGKQQRKYLGYYTTQKEALVALADYHNKGLNLDISKLTLKDVWDMWVERVSKRVVSESVMNSHMMAYKRLGAFLNKPIKEIKTIHLQEWMDGIDLKPGTKTKVKSTLGQLFEYAAQNDIVSKNYAKFIEINEKVEKTGSMFTEDEISKLWEIYNTEKDSNARILLMLIYNGVRIGELLDITRDDINFEEMYMTGGSKTEAGKNRVIPIHKKLLPLYYESLGENKHLITDGKKGKKATYDMMYVRINKLFKRLGFDHTIHDTRRTTISLLHTANVPMETIKIIVGHSGDNVTEKVYLFKQPSELVNAINMIEI